MPVLAPLIVGSILAYDLRCEALTDPLVIQPTQPQLSWKLKAAHQGGRGLGQKAYRILVASSPTLLQKDKGDLWDSGKVASNASFGIKYEGSKLSSKTRCWWKVKVWDQVGQGSAWSNLATFGTGLDKSDWKAEWIHGNKPTAVPEVITEASWIQSGGVPEGDAPAGQYVYRRSFTAKRGAKAHVALTADNTFVLRLNHREVSRTTDPEGWRNLKSVDLTEFIQDGLNDVEVEVTNATPSPTGLIAALTVGSFRVSIVLVLQVGSGWLYAMVICGARVYSAEIIHI